MGVVKRRPVVTEEIFEWFGIIVILFIVDQIDARQTSLPMSVGHWFRLGRKLCLDGGLQIFELGLQHFRSGLSTALQFVNQCLLPLIV